MQENPIKALILRDNAADAVQTAHLLLRKGFQTYCVGSRDIALAMIQTDMIDLVVMDERVGTQLTHMLALSAERRNPYVGTIFLTDRGGAATDDLFALIPSLYALVGTKIRPDVMGQLMLGAVATTDEAARRIDREIAIAAAECAMPEDDDLWAKDGSDVPAVAEMTGLRPRRWGDYSGLRPQGMPVVSASVVVDQICA